MHATVILVTAAALGIIQGLTEFLPISSSAHLILARTMLGWDTQQFGLAFDVACHVGTLLSLVVYFWSDLRVMAASLPRLISGGSPAARQARLIAAGTVPIVIIGWVFSNTLEQSVRTPFVAACMLAVGAVFLLIVERVGTHIRDEHSLTMAEAVTIGVAQGAALVPGVSRSGITITVGMFMGLRREGAARFAFLLGIPAMAAAGAKEALEVAQSGLAADVLAAYAVGFATSAVVGYLTVKYFIQYLANHRLDVFAVYRLVLAGITLLWL